MYNEIMSLSSPRFGPEQALYPISVVTELTGIGAHTLRGYERAGLVTPARTEGGTRRYSDNDVARLRRILTLVGDGINLSGVGRILQLEAELAALRAQLAAESPPDGR
jgi:MerR family transcriptional regulator/heat shock protein HspR